MTHSLSGMELDSKDQSSSYEPDVLESKTEMEDDELEETFAAENISLDETGASCQFCQQSRVRVQILEKKGEK